MRFSSVLLASFTVSAGLGSFSPVLAQDISLVNAERESSERSYPTSDQSGQSELETEFEAIEGDRPGSSASWKIGSALPFMSLLGSDISPPAESLNLQFSPADAGASSSTVIPSPQDTVTISSPSASSDLMAQINDSDDDDTLNIELNEDNPEDFPIEVPENPEVPEVEPEEEPVTPGTINLPLPSDTDAEFETGEEEPRVLVAEVLVIGAESRPELETIVYQSIDTQAGRTTTRSQLQDDINAVFSTGFFSNVEAVPEDTPLGVRITFAVDPNPVLSDVQITGSALQEQGILLTVPSDEPGIDITPDQLTVQETADRVFSPQYGSTLNLLEFQDGVERLNEIYQNNGYVLAQVIDAPPPQNGVVQLEVAEGVIEDIEITFLDEDGQAVDEDGEPVEGRTRDFIITRQFESEPGDVFNQSQIQADLRRAFALGIFDDVRVALDPGDDPRKVDVIVNVIEGNTGSVAAGVGFSSASGVFGSLSYQQQNLGGNNQRLGAEVQFGQRELLFDIRFTDPWIATDPYQTSYTVNAFSRRSISLIFDGGENEVELDNGDRPRVQRLGGGVSFSRPLDEWLGWEGWRASTGFQFQRVSIRDADGDLTPEDEEGNDLSFSGDGTDDIITLQLAAVRDRRNNPTQPTSGSLLRFGTEQSLPFGQGSILFNRLRASYSYYIPVEFTDFTDGAEALAFNFQGGTVLGDLPPYEAFSLGGTDSVRGYDAGELGSGRSFLQATAEYRFPVFSIIGGALFVDFGTDLGTASDVPGEPAEVRDKPGTGFGYGIGVRVQSPLGPIRVDYGINDDGDGRIHFGIGERF